MSYVGVLDRPSQQEPVPGKNMVKNNAGGYSFKLDKWAHLDRFLSMGTSGGTYYVGERELTLKAADSVIACLKIDGPRVVRTILDRKSTRLNSSHRL